jgi:hypothetical protein
VPEIVRRAHDGVRHSPSRPGKPFHVWNWRCVSGSASTPTRL